MNPPLAPGGPGVAGPEGGPASGGPSRIPTWASPAIGAMLVLVAGQSWTWALWEPLSPTTFGRALLLLIGLLGVVGLLVRGQRQARETEASLRGMTGALHRSQHELQERRASEQSLRDAERSKDEFLATLCHELRNPLAVIEHAGELLDDRSANEEQKRWAVRMIRNQTRQLAILIDDLFDLSRIASGTMSLNLQAVSLPDLVRTAVDAARPFLEEADQAVVLQLPEAPAWIQADPSRIQQILVNLLSNACRYSDPGRTITVGLRSEPPEVVLQIKDQGIGIDPSLMPRIFGTFVRGDEARDRCPTGLGIGLRLVRLIVEHHGGSIVARSEGPGRGSEFEIRLPQVDAPSIARPEAVPPDSPRPLRLLIVDDNRAMLDALRLLLRREGHEVRVSRTGREALEAVAEEAPDLILLDLQLPDIDGIEVARSLGPSGPPIIALTGSNHPLPLDELQGIGFRSFLQKPVRIEVLRQSLAQLSPDPEQAS